MGMAEIPEPALPSTAPVHFPPRKARKAPENRQAKGEMQGVRGIFTDPPSCPESQGDHVGCAFSAPEPGPHMLPGAWQAPGN